MEGYFLVITVALVACYLLVYPREKPRIRQEPQQEEQLFPYYKKSHLFTHAERLFFSALQEAVGSRFVILGKVRASDLLMVPSSLSWGEYRQALNRINRQCAQFVLCRRDNYSIVCVIELEDGRLAENPTRKKDTSFARVLAAASLPLISFAEQGEYDPLEITSAILKGLEKNTLYERQSCFSFVPGEGVVKEGLQKSGARFAA